MDALCTAHTQPLRYALVRVHEGVRRRGKARSGNLGHLRNTRRRQAEQHYRSQHLQQQTCTSRDNQQMP